MNNFILFNRIPIKDNLKDHYSNAMRNANEDDCLTLYRDKCPFSILKLIFSNDIK